MREWDVSINSNNTFITKDVMPTTWRGLIHTIQRAQTKDGLESCIKPWCWLEEWGFQMPNGQDVSRRLHLPCWRVKWWTLSFALPTMTTIHGIRLNPFWQRHERMYCEVEVSSRHLLRVYVSWMRYKTTHRFANCSFVVSDVPFRPFDPSKTNLDSNKSMY
jgi:hypothetical protein